MGNDSENQDGEVPFPLPRITIKFCTQCKWMLRAAYFAQELISTFSTSLGEVALQPGTGGVFVVEMMTTGPPPAAASTDLGGGGGGGGPNQPGVRRVVLWDRKADGGFPETKELKRRVRDVIDPARDLGHVDRDHRPAAAPAANSIADSTTATGSDDPVSAPGAAPTGPSASASALSASRAAPSQRLSGVKPAIPPPPARLQEAAQKRVAEARARRAEREAGGEEGTGEAGGVSGGGGREDHRCEDCE